MAPVMEQLARDLGTKAKVYQASVDDAADVMSSLGIMGLPTFVFFKDGKEADRVVGMAKIEAMKAKADALTAS